MPLTKAQFNKLRLADEREAMDALCLARPSGTSARGWMEDFVLRQGQDTCFLSPSCANGTCRLRCLTLRFLQWSDQDGRRERVPRTTTVTWNHCGCEGRTHPDPSFFCVGGLQTLAFVAAAAAGAL